ncbi:hypothetical protein HpBT072_03940 [Helicobacter pylori]
MIKYSKECEKDLANLRLTEEEKEIIKGIRRGILPPSNLGRDDIILLQRLESRHYMKALSLIGCKNARARKAKKGKTISFLAPQTLEKWLWITA